jgi:hypothetical protein
MSMGGDWSQDHPVVIGGTPYVGMSVFLVAKDERGFGGPVLGGIVGALTSGLTLEFLGVVGDLAGLAGLAGTAAGILGKYLDDAAAGRPVLCRYDLSSPQIDVGYKVMAPAPSRPVRGFPILGGKKKEWTTSRAVCVRAALKKDAGCEHAHPRTFSPYEYAMLKTHTHYGRVPHGWEAQTSTRATSSVCHVHHNLLSSVVSSGFPWSRRASCSCGPPRGACRRPCA